MRRKDISYVSDGLISDLDDHEAVHWHFADFFEVVLENSLFEEPLNDCQVRIDIHGLSFFEFGTLPANQVNQTFRLEASSLNFFLGLDFDLNFLGGFFPGINENLSSNNVSCPEELASFRAELIDFFGNQFPKTFITWTFTGFLFLLFQVIVLGR